MEANIFLLGAIDHHGECNINTGSDFIAQYTTRQEYRYADTVPEYDRDLMKSLNSSKSLDLILFRSKAS